MQGNAGGKKGTYGTRCSDKGLQGNAVECQGNAREWLQSVRGMQENAGGCRGMPGERMGVGAMRQGNAMVMYRSGCKVPEECHENIWE